MASTVFDSALFRDMFGTAEMREIFSDEALVARYLEAEAALARAQARLGVVPKEAALAIDAGGEIRFEPGFGLEELLKGWPTITKKVI